MKMINRAAMLIFEKAGGDVIEVSGEDILPYDLKAPVIEIKDDDFGIWYVDAMENPDRYEGKTVQFTGMAYREPNFPAGYFVPGRFAMTCCANDMQFMGYLCKSKVAEKLKKDTWVEVTAVVHHEYMEAYGGQAPVLYAKRVARESSRRTSMSTYIETLGQKAKAAAADLAGLTPQEKNVCLRAAATS